MTSFLLQKRTIFEFLVSHILEPFNIIGSSLALSLPPQPKSGSKKINLHITKRIGGAHFCSLKVMSHQSLNLTKIETRSQYNIRTKVCKFLAAIIAAREVVREYYPRPEETLLTAPILACLLQQSRSPYFLAVATYPS